MCCRLSKKAVSSTVPTAKMAEGGIQAPEGVLIVNKPSGMTSHKIVGIVRRLYGTRTVGHAGTLDPLAEGVLVVLIGRAVKASEYLMESGKDSRSRKTYTALLRLGIATDTDDITGKVTDEFNGSLPGEAEVLSALDAFRGEIMQVPPMYSALKRGGKKLYELAREGVTLELEPRPVTIYRLDAECISDSDYSLRIECSSGTYIRALCRDIGTALGCCGTMAALRRDEACGFTLDMSYSPEVLEAMDGGERLALLRPAESLFYDLEALTLQPFFARLASCGAEIYLKKLGISDDCRFTPGTRVRLCDEQGFFALGEVRQFGDGPAIKPVKQFRI